MTESYSPANLYDLIKRRVPIGENTTAPAPILGDAQLSPDWETTKGLVEPKKASVLILIVDRSPVPGILLTKRTEHLAAHPGQISFPGGSHEAGDADDLDTALRETREEIGVASDRVEIIGKLNSYRTVTDFIISPYVGVAKADLELKIDSNEVESAFELPLSYLMDPDQHRIESRLWNGQERFFYAMPYEDYYIWGATAAILVNLYQALLLHSDRADLSRGE